MATGKEKVLSVLYADNLKRRTGPGSEVQASSEAASPGDARGSSKYIINWVRNLRRAVLARQYREN